MTSPLHCVNILPGDPAPVFKQRTPTNPQFAFDTAAGRYLVLCFFGSARDVEAQNALSAAFARTDLFNDTQACFFGISNDPTDEIEARVANRIPGFRFFWDFDLKVAKLWGALPKEAEPEQAATALSRFWIILDPTLRVIANIPFTDGGANAASVMEMVADLPPPSHYAGIELQAPVLYLPRIFEPELCQSLIEHYEKEGGQESGFMREVKGRTMRINDAKHKRRKDCDIVDKAVITKIQALFMRKILPEIAKVHQFKVTRMERYIVACYAAEDEAHFAAHRDNTTLGTAHRRFAVSVNLNDDFDGGEVSFPEYGPRSFKPPAGCALVFSCSLLHKVSKVTRHRRFAFLPFLYDDAAAAVRQQNAAMVGEQGSTYRLK